MRFLVFRGLRAAFLIGASAAAGTAGDVRFTSRLGVQRIGLHMQYIMAIAKFAGLGGEPEIGDSGNLHGDVIAGDNFEAGGPGSIGFVLQVKGQILVLEICQAKPGGDGSAAESSSLYRQPWLRRIKHEGIGIMASHTEQEASSFAFPSCAESYSV